MGVQNELYLDSVDRVEVLAGPTGRRRWPDEVKCQLVAESLGAGRNAAKKRPMPPRIWKQAMKQFTVLFHDRFPSSIY